MTAYVNGINVTTRIYGPLSLGDTTSAQGLTGVGDLVANKLEVQSNSYFAGAGLFSNNAYITGIMTKIGAQNSNIGLRHISENVTIPVGSGATPVVETTGDLAPAGSLIMGITARVVTAPGGGATTLDIGITGSGNLDALVDGMSTVATTTATSPINNDGTQLPIVNDTASTLTLTTDSDVTVSDMLVRIGVFYFDFTAQTL